MEVLGEGSSRPAAGSCAEAMLGRLAAGASVEATPSRVLGRGGAPWSLPRGSRVYLPSIEGADFGETLAAVARVAATGLVPVPHLAARTLRSRPELDARLGRLREAGADALLLVAGDRDEPAGPFTSTLAVLDSGLLLAHGFGRLGVAGHPEGHFRVPREALDRALAAKRDYARATGSELWIVTQFVFSADATVSWLARLRAATPGMAVHVGLPGPARLTTLLAYAAHCGVGTSARLLRRNPRSARLLGNWTPDGLLRDLVGRCHGDGRALFDALHVFPFGGIERCARWLAGLADLAAVAADERETCP